MPSLRQRMTTYLRQLSFINEQRDDTPTSHRGRRIPSPSHHQTGGSISGGTSTNGCFVTQFLEGRMTRRSLHPDTEIKHGKEPADLPELLLLAGSCNDTVTAACTGPDEGLASIRRSRLHLSAGPEIDFIDTNQDQMDELDVRRSTPNAKLRNARHTSGITLADPNANQIQSLSKPNTFNTKNNESPSSVNNCTENLNASHKPKNVTINLVVSTISNSSKLTKLELEEETKDLSEQFKFCPPMMNDNESPPISRNVAGELQGRHTTNADDPAKCTINWNLENDHAYGLSVSLYEKNCVNDERVGDPIADCYGLIARGQSAALAMADGVNWGEGARLAARSAVKGCLEYLDTAIFGQGAGGQAKTTREVFVSLLRSFWEAHACILEVGGALSTLTAAVVLPLGVPYVNRHIVCACNVGDSFGYVYSKKHGVREFTQGSHDIKTMRDMRDALGALGPVCGNNPELGNLTLSMTIVEPGDIVFLTSDGISDNFDPVVGKFAEPFSEQRLIAPLPNKTADSGQQLAPKRQNRSTSAIVSTPSSIASHPPQTPSSSVAKETHRTSHKTVQNSTKTAPTSCQNRPPSAQLAAPERPTGRPKFLRSHTVIEPRTIKKDMRKMSNHLPRVTGQQRHALTLLRLEDLLSFGINGTQRPCPSARKLCHLLVDFAKMISSARRNLLEQRELYYRLVLNVETGNRTEVVLNKLQQRSARKRLIDGTTFSQLPGKLDHASVIAFTVESAADTDVEHTDLIKNESNL